MVSCRWVGESTVVSSLLSDSFPLRNTQRVTSADLTLRNRLSAWTYAFQTTNPPESGVVDGMTKWLVVTRAGVLPLTLFSGLIALLLAAVAEGAKDWLGLTLAVVGILVAHLANNMMNDLADTETGNDTVDYPRALYAPHPILAGLVTKKQLIVAILAANVIDLAIMIFLTLRHGWAILFFALAGLLLSYAYTAPPLRLKKYGLGELDVLLTWGPLMVGGVYYAGLGTVSWKVMLAATVYALLPTTVLMGKHIDKIPYDAPAGTHTLPVLLGEERAKLATRAMLALYYLGVIACVLVGAMHWLALATLLALPAAWPTWKAFGAPKPTEQPEGNVVWPLWFAPVAFVHMRRAGGLLVLGLAAAAIWHAVG
jgi:1,4-dihydroxy-2-naphthoate octaprenyltransferase